MSLLLIWEEVPDGIKAYVLKGRPAELARLSAGKYINGGVTEGEPIEELSEILDRMKAIKTDEPIKGPFDEVVVCGFIM